jgi:DNA mismatch endonuclease (patch repair protein)
VLPKYNTVIFINGCFWHKHEGCKYFVWPKSNEDFWKAKIERNVERDKQLYEQLRQLGWKVIVVWECEIRTRKKQATRLPMLAEEIIDGGSVK